MLIALLLTVAAAGILGGSAATGEIVASFDPAAGEFPEGIAVDSHGALFVSLAPLGEVRRLGADGAWTTVHRFPTGTSGFGVLGLAADRHGTLYAAVPSTDPAAHGVWALPFRGPARRLPGSGQVAFPNGIAIDPHGTLYVSDSVLGAVWRIPPDGPAALWLRDESLAGTGELNALLGESPPTPLGANGIAYRHGGLLVANTDRKQVVEIPVDHDGAPGTPVVLHRFSGSLDFLDGIAVDIAGNAYVVVAGMQLVRLDHRTDEATVVAGAADGLRIPASLAFGTRATAKRRLYLTNFSPPPLVALAFGAGAPPEPSVVAVDVPLPGPPLP
jgi:sugar lactone lactonase YvrE